MKIIDDIIEDLANKLSSIDYDYLTEKEFDRADKFLCDLSKRNEYMDTKQVFIDHPELAPKSCVGLINGFNSYIESLKLKEEKRKNIPGWYRLNKLDGIF